MSAAPPFRLRLAAIHFLNPAPLLYSFEHPPSQQRLAERYDLRYTSPAACADQLNEGTADLGLVPVGALPSLPEVAVVPGCAIAALHSVRSIQLVIKPGKQLHDIRSVAADAASRSSAAYMQVLLRHYHRNAPAVVTMPADLRSMLEAHDAALLIGDPALLALEDRAAGGIFAGCTWIDVATWWRDCTGLPWVAAVWAARPDALVATATSADDLRADLQGSRDAGLAHIPELVDTWRTRIALPAETIRSYLTRNIHYVLDDACIAGTALFHRLATETGVLPPYRMRWL